MYEDRIPRPSDRFALLDVGQPILSAPDLPTIQPGPPVIGDRVSSDGRTQIGATPTGG
ncbi:MAG: hypothetical protein ACK5Q5_04190 [Planctomycetaceae bacterium]